MGNYFKPYIVRAGIIAGIIGGVIALIGIIPILGGLIACLISPITWIVYAVGGVLAVMWGKAQGATQTIQQGALDGAIAGAIAGVIAGVVGWFVNICNTLFFSAFAATSGSNPDITAVVVPIVFGFVGIFGSIIFAAILGAIGGLIFAAIQQNQQKNP